jgi:hypothetical protein
MTTPVKNQEIPMDQRQPVDCNRLWKLSRWRVTEEMYKDMPKDLKTCFDNMIYFHRPQTIDCWNKCKKFSLRPGKSECFWDGIARKCIRVVTLYNFMTGSQRTVEEED